MRAELVRRRIGDLRRLSREIAETKVQIEEVLAQLGTTLTHLPGIGPLIAAKILGELGTPTFGVDVSSSGVEVRVGVVVRVVLVVPSPPPVDSSHLGRDR